MHGLGFYSNWQDLVGLSSLTPDISPLVAGERLVGINQTSGEIVLTSALESVFDKFLVRLTDMQHTSSITRKFNKYRLRENKPVVQSLQEIGLLDDAKAMYELGTKAESLGFVAANDSSAILVLETGLSPFQSGSSISHVDYNMYGDSAEFLMRFMQERGLTLDQAMVRSDSSSPIGPKLRKVLKSIGYNTIDYQPRIQLPAPRLNSIQSTGYKISLLVSSWVFPVVLSCTYFL
jgi:hypothetical protein